MKSIKLKPVYVPNNDIFVCPPDFIDYEIEVSAEKPKNKTFSSTEQLKTILRGRQSKSSSSKKSKKEEYEDSVKKLSDWKILESPKSSLKRKFTFKRKTTLINDSRVSVRSVSLNQTQEPLPKADSFERVFNSIIVIEKLKKKLTNSETRQATEQNLDLESSIKVKILKVNQEITELKTFFNENQAKLTKLRKDLEEFQRNHGENLKKVSTQEAQELLFSEKARKKMLKPGEESRYFIQKEKLRQQKQDLHKHYQEVHEYHSRKIEDLRGLLQITKTKKQECKKSLKSHREEMVALYCRALKDGKDVRSDGLRWIIKSLWKMNECVPFSSFPKFFDDDSCQFLLTMAEKDLQMENFTKKLEAVKKEIRNKRTKFSISDERELYRNVRSRLRSISQSSVGQYADGRSVDESENCEKVSESPEKGFYLQFSGLKDKISALSEVVKEITVSEVKRITALYQMDPGEGEKIGLFHLIRCLVGDKVREFYKYTQPVNNRTFRISRKIQ